MISSIEMHFYRILAKKKPGIFIVLRDRLREPLSGFGVNAALQICVIMKVLLNAVSCGISKNSLVGTKSAVSHELLEVFISRP